MFLFGGKELFYQKECKFTRVGVDQIRRRSLNLQAGLGFAPSLVALRRLLPQNFDSRSAFAQDDDSGGIVRKSLPKDDSAPTHMKKTWTGLFSL